MSDCAVIRKMATATTVVAMYSTPGMRRTGGPQVAEPAENQDTKLLQAIKLSSYEYRVTLSID